MLKSEFEAKVRELAKTDRMEAARFIKTMLGEDPRMVSSLRALIIEFRPEFNKLRADKWKQ